MSDPEPPRVRPFIGAGSPRRPDGRPARRSRPDADDPQDPAGLLRPYQMTGGRTAPADPSLAIEAQVVARPEALANPDRLSYEHRELVNAARTPVSVAELGALLHIHLQVVRVLVGDLAASGALGVLQPRRGTATDPNIIERVIRGLSAIA